MADWLYVFRSAQEAILVDATERIHPKVYGARGFRRRGGFDYRTDVMIKLAVNCLSDPSIEKAFAYLYIPELKLISQRVWGRSVMEMRRAVLAHTGEYGDPSPVDERSIFLKDGGSVRRGGITLARHGNYFWFSSFEMDVGVWLEFCALILRDEYTAQIDKRYYVPFLVCRPAMEFTSGMILPSAPPPQRVAAWQAHMNEADSRPDNIPAAKEFSFDVQSKNVEIPERSSEHGETIPVQSEPASSMSGIEPIAILARSSGDQSIVLVKEKNEKFRLFQGQRVTVDEEEEHLEFTSELERFESFKEFLELMILVGRSSEFLEFGPDGGLEPIWEQIRFNSWLVPIEGTTKPAMTKSRESVKRALRKIGQPRAVSLRQGDSSLSENLTWHAPRGGLSRADVIRWVILAHCCKQAEEFPAIYLPELSVLLSGDETSAPTRASSTQPTTNLAGATTVSIIFEHLRVAQDRLITAVTAKFL